LGTSIWAERRGPGVVRVRHFSLESPALAHRTDRAVRGRSGRCRVRDRLPTRAVPSH
jgi:hypothetical protein